MIRVLGISLLLTVLLFALTFSSVSAVGHPQPDVAPNGRIDQGCVNQGRDRRIAAPIVCGLQRKLSWKSEHAPKLFRIGSRFRTHAEVAWPPYLVINSPDGQGHWRMFRIGFRYDRTWHGYIFPTAACKGIDHPLQY
jgi:hypothetical protein